MGKSKQKISNWKLYNLAWRCEKITYSWAVTQLDLQAREAFPQAAYATQLTSCLTGIPSTVILFIAFTPASASPTCAL